MISVNIALWVNIINASDWFSLFTYNFMFHFSWLYFADLECPEQNIFYEMMTLSVEHTLSLTGWLKMYDEWTARWEWLMNQLDNHKSPPKSALLPTNEWMNDLTIAPISRHTHNHIFSVDGEQMNKRWINEMTASLITSSLATVSALFLMRKNKWTVQRVNKQTNKGMEWPHHTSLAAQTHHHVGAVAEAVAVVVGGDDLEGEVGAAHVAVVDGRLDDARVCLDHEAVVGGALLGRRDDQPVRHGAEVPRVCVGGLWWFKTRI